MALRNWPRRRIVWLWVAGGVLEAALAAGTWRVTRTEPGWPGSAALSSAWADSTAAALTPEPRRERMRTVLDSIAVHVRALGDTATSYQLSDSMILVIDRHGVIRDVQVASGTKEQLERLAAGIVDAWGELFWRLVWWAAALFLPIPAALLGTTVLWWRQRRRIGSAKAAATKQG